MPLLFAAHRQLVGSVLRRPDCRTPATLIAGCSAGCTACSCAASRVLGNIGPNWFASVMGTGIVATAGATLPVHVPGLRGFTEVVWVIAAILLTVLVLAVGGHWLRHPTVARSHARNPQMAHFYGAAPMALLTVGAGALLVGRELIGERIAVDLAWVLWTAGTLGGLFTAVSIPFLMFTQYNVEPDAAFGGWLMPVVPPMVSAATGALLIPHMAAGTGRETMLYGCYAMFGLSLVASLVIISMIWSRLTLYGTSGTARVPTLWIVLGPARAVHHRRGLLGTYAALAVGPEIADGMSVFAILYGVPVWGFAVLWIALATSLTVRTLRRGHAVRADLVEPDLPGRHVRDGYHATRRAHPSAGVRVCRGDRLPGPAVHLGPGGRPHRTGQRPRQPAAAAEQRCGQGTQGSGALTTWGRTAPARCCRDHGTRGCTSPRCP